MKTKPIYLEDPYKKIHSAKVLSVEKNDSGIFEIILDETIFYPMGGGQSTDQGILKSGNETISIQEVLVKNGEIIHFTQNAGALKQDEEVRLEIDWDRRYKHMKIHTAGHIIDFALQKIQLVPEKLKPVKAKHGKKAFIEYKGSFPESEEDKLKKTVNEIVSKDLEFSWEFTSFEELEQTATYLQPGLPKNKPLRALNLERIGTVADGGTITKKTSEVGAITITSIKTDNDVTTISYNVSDNSPNTSKNTKDIGNQESVKLSNDFESILTKVKDEVDKLDSEEELTKLWRKYLGKKGTVKQLMQKISVIPKEEKSQYGKEVNELKNRIDTVVNSAKESIANKTKEAYLNEKVGTLNFEKPKIGHLHPLTQTINEINNVLKRLGYSVYDGPEIETDEYVFQRCNVPMDHPARDLQDSIYIEEPNILLRTQTSSIEAHALEELNPPFKIIMPGRAYRNEKVNKSNHFMFHQYQLVCVQEKVSLAELISTIEFLFKNFLGESVVTRYRNKYYPEVEPGVGPDMRCFNCEGDGCVICKKRGWMEMGGAGIIHPNMMKMAGLDTNKWQGFAFGLGLDRWAMAKFNITDIRTLLGESLAYKPFVSY